MIETAPGTPAAAGHAAQPSPTAEPGPAAGPASARSRWPFVVLGLALIWIVLVRVPLILNAASHLDSDLAVDGITLRDALHGKWRWHYPGTPHSGILPVLYSLPQAAIWGATPTTLVSGGTVAFAALAVSTFAMAWVVFGREVAAWSLVPLTFASTGALWLSGRVTGGHLSSAVWHAVAFLLLYACLTRGSWKLGLALGVWSGLGVYVDMMYVLTLAGLVPAAAVCWWRSGRSRSGLIAAVAFAIGYMAGLAPREIGTWVDPHDAYPSQFVPTKETGPLLNHLRLLGLECLPRLITGHRLPDLQADPDPSALGGPAPSRGPRDTSRFALASTVVLLVLFLASIRAVADPRSTPGDRAAAAVRWGLLISAVATLAAFVVNRNIFNSDNYRYLVTLLVPWSIGFGLSMRAMTRLGWPGLAAAAGCSLTVAVLMTVDTARWYHRFGWVDRAGRPVLNYTEDPALTWLNRHREVDRFHGGYWDVYRLTFLAARPVRGIPFKIFPDRFPEWSRDLPGGHAEFIIGRRFQGYRGFYDQALRDGGDFIERGPGFTVVSWPQREDQR